MVVGESVVEGQGDRWTMVSRNRLWVYGRLWIGNWRAMEVVFVVVCAAQSLAQRTTAFTRVDVRLSP